MSSRSTIAYYSEEEDESYVHIYHECCEDVICIQVEGNKGDKYGDPILSQECLDEIIKQLAEYKKNKERRNGAK